MTDPATRILMVDDSRLARESLKAVLDKYGIFEVRTAGSAQEAFALLGVDQPQDENSETEFDAVMLDIVMADMNGLEACRRIKAQPHLQDLPIIMVTARTDVDTLVNAFEAGAMDFVSKPVKEGELVARLNSAITLKREVKRRRKRERQLLETASRLTEANRKLKRISSLDGLTEVPNRRFFDTALDREWRRARRQSGPFSLILIDIDRFKKYNDRYGHLAGDDCLKKVAKSMAGSLSRASDVLARYGGEEFAVILPETDLEGAKQVAERLRAAVEGLALEHQDSPAGVTTISLGAASVVPDKGRQPSQLIEAADQALYESKESGRNRVTTRSLDRAPSER